MIDLSIVSYVISAVMLIVSILTFVNASRERHEKSAAEQAQIAVKLESLETTLTDVKATVDELRGGHHENRVDIEKLDTRMTGLEGRIKKAEVKIVEIEGKMHDYHAERR